MPLGFLLPANLRFDAGKPVRKLAYRGSAYPARVSGVAGSFPCRLHPPATPAEDHPQALNFLVDENARPASADHDITDRAQAQEGRSPPLPSHQTARERYALPISVRTVPPRSRGAMLRSRTAGKDH